MRRRARSLEVPKTFLAIQVNIEERAPPLLQSKGPGASATRRRPLGGSAGRPNRAEARNLILREEPCQGREKIAAWQFVGRWGPGPTDGAPREHRGRAARGEYRCGTGSSLGEGLCLPRYLTFFVPRASPGLDAPRSEVRVPSSADVDHCARVQ